VVRLSLKLILHVFDSHLQAFAARKSACNGMRWQNEQRQRGYTKVDRTKTSRGVGKAKLAVSTLRLRYLWLDHQKPVATRTAPPSCRQSGPERRTPTDSHFDKNADESLHDGNDEADERDDAHKNVEACRSQGLTSAHHPARGSRQAEHSLGARRLSAKRTRVHAPSLACAH